MEQLNQSNGNDRGATSERAIPSRINVLMTPAIQTRQIPNLNGYRTIENNLPEDTLQTKAGVRACKVYRRSYQEAMDHLKRADRDLGETVAVIAASLTTVTAVEAVINIAHDKIQLSREFLLVTFDAYIAAFLLILLWGTLRSMKAIHRRTQAEQDVDQAKKGIFEFCPGDQWPKTED